MKITRKQLRHLIKEALLIEGEYGKSRRNPFGSCADSMKKHWGSQHRGLVTRDYQFPLPARKVKLTQAQNDAKEKALDKFFSEMNYSQEDEDILRPNSIALIAPYDPKVGKICVRVVASDGLANVKKRLQKKKEKE